MTSRPDVIIKQLSEVIDDLDDSVNENGYLEDYDAQRIATRARAAIRRYARHPENPRTAASTSAHRSLSRSFPLNCGYPMLLGQPNAGTTLPLFGMQP
jgi:hypothetical protein